ncbi:lipopolysaccharide biosynthesis protein [Chloroflexota bacterium]
MYYVNMLRRFVTIPIYRNALYLIFNTAITSLLGFLFWVAIARFYSGAELGFASSIISAINLIAIVSVVGLNFSLVRFLSQADRPKELINSSFTLSIIISLVAAGVFIAGLDLWSPALSFVAQNIYFAITFIVAAIMSTLLDLIDAVFLARRRVGFVFYRNTVISILRIPLSIALAISFQTFGVVSSWAIGLGTGVAISFFLLLPRVEDGYKPVPTLNMSRIKGTWQYSGNSYLSSLLSQVPVMILPLMVVNLLGAESSAYYYLAWTIANLLFAIPRSISQSLFAEGSFSKKTVKENVMRSIKLTFILLIPAVAILILAGKWILLAFGPSYSANALHLLWLLGLSSLPRGLNSVYTSLLRVKDGLKELIIIQLFIAVAVLALSFLLMQYHGIIGIGYVWLGVQVLVSIVLSYRLVTRLSQLNVTKGSVSEGADTF